MGFNPDIPPPGSYVFIEASQPRVAGDRAILNSPSFKADGQCKLNFWYHMYGSGIADLNLHLVNESGTFKVYKFIMII